MNSAASVALPTKRRNAWLAQLARAALFAAGLGLAIWLIRSAGTDGVLAVLRDAGRWLVLVMLLEVGLVLGDVFAARTLLGLSSRRVKLATWVRSTTLAYAATVFLPAGRATGEVVRATTLAPHVGTGRATGTSTRLQACSLLANGVISAITATTVFWYWGTGGWLGLALVGNGVACVVFGTVLLLLARSTRLGAWLRRRMKLLAEKHAVPEDARPTEVATFWGVLCCCVGRFVQTLQYGVVVYAVGGAAKPSVAFIAQGIHLVGAAIGDVIPSQMGATEGAYRAFAGAVGFEAEPARALSAALLVRIAQIGLAVLCLAVGALVRRQVRVESSSVEPSP